MRAKACLGRDFKTPFAGPIGLESLIKSSYVWAEKGKECTDRRVEKMSNTFDIFSILFEIQGLQKHAFIGVTKFDKM